MAALRIVSQASAEAQWDRVKGHTLAASLEAARFGLSLEAREGQNLHTRLKGRKGLYPLSLLRSAYVRVFVRSAGGTSSAP